MFTIQIRSFTNKIEHSIAAPKATAASGSTSGSTSFLHEGEDACTTISSYHAEERRSNILTLLLQEGDRSKKL